MSFDDFFGRLIAIIESASVDYMLVGSVASITHGEARTTRDADVVVALDQASAERLIAAFPADTWYADLDMALEAVFRRRSFNVIDEVTFWKVDFIVKAETPFDSAAFARRQRVLVLDHEACVATAEDTVISNLRGPWRLAKPEPGEKSPSFRVLGEVRKEGGSPPSFTHSASARKLRWAAAGGSERQLEDVAGVLRVQGEALDRVYIERWIAVLGLDLLWARVNSAPTAVG